MAKLEPSLVVGMLWMTVSSWPVSVVVFERPSLTFDSMVVIKIANPYAWGRMRPIKTKC